MRWAPVAVVMDKDGCWLCHLFVGKVVKLHNPSKPESPHLRSWITIVPVPLDWVAVRTL